MKHPEAEVRGQAISNSVYLVWNERTVTALAEALCDPVVGVRQEAGLQLFTCGAAAEPATEALIAALDDADVKVRALAAAALSNIGPPAREALPTLAKLRDASDDRLRIWVAEAEARIAVRPSGA
jgi:HEAT repeat protein